MHMLDAVTEIYKYRENYTIIGLTGMTGSGCSTVAKILSSETSEIRVTKNYRHEKMTNDERSHNIILKYFEKKWHKFFLIKASDIIASFSFECTFDEFKSYIKQLSKIDISDLKEIFENTKTKSDILKKAESKETTPEDNLAIKNLSKLIFLNLPRL